MSLIHLYCKANKRKRHDQVIGVYAYRLKEEESCLEKVELLEEETRVARLELLALTAGLKALEAKQALNADNQVHIYVTNEYILEELMKGIKDHRVGKPLDFNKGEEYLALWEEVETLLAKCAAYEVTGLGKKERGPEEAEIKSHMGALNKKVCDTINGYFKTEKQ